ncbi:MAG: glycosyltransferase [Betaproteobacteria bacterium]
MNTASDIGPRVTIVMTARERHSLTVSAIESIVEKTRLPFRLIYVDCESPPWLREIFATRAETWGLEVVRIDEPLWPQQARARMAESIRTEYTVFIDNDVDVETGWLDSLLACADETGAGIVGPLYLAGDGVQPDRIHMAGGRLVESADPNGRVVDEVHVHAGEDPQILASELRRQPCDFVEYHCMLIRTELLHAGVLDPDIRCVHEHIDTSMTARGLGFDTYLEPAARITYLAGAEYTLDDLPFFRARWTRADADASIAAFCNKWNVIEDERSFGGVWRFVTEHVAQLDPIRPSLRDHPDHHVPMPPGELKQTRSDLLDVAREREYSWSALAIIANAYGLAHLLLDGAYRACGRPFINHLAGTASVLVHYGFRAETIAAGLLHSAYTHCASNAGGVEAVCNALGARGNALERRVRAYTLRNSRAGGVALTSAEFSTLSVLEAEIIAIIAANEIDMYMSGEIRYSGRTDLIGPTLSAQIARVCDTLGVDGLYQTLRREQEREVSVPREFMTGVRGSYRIGKDSRSPVPMATNVPAGLLGTLNLS